MIMHITMMMMMRITKANDDDAEAHLCFFCIHIRHNVPQHLDQNIHNICGLDFHHICDLNIHQISDIEIYVKPPFH